MLMGVFLLLVSVCAITLMVGFIINEKYKKEMQELIDEINLLRQKHYLPETTEKDYQTNYQGQNENETFTWNVENKKK